MAAPLTVSGMLTGSQEVPAVATSATGNVTGTYDPISMELKYSVTFAGLKPTIAHFHIGGAGVKGPVFLGFKYNDAAGTGFVSPITGTATLTTDQATALLSNAVYANLHSAANPGGEIRADMTAK